MSSAENCLTKCHLTTMCSNYFWSKIVLVHGITTPSIGLKGMVDDLAHRGYRVMTYGGFPCSFPTSSSRPMTQSSDIPIIHLIHIFGFNLGSFTGIRLNQISTDAATPTLPASSTLSRYTSPNSFFSWTGSSGLTARIKLTSLGSLSVVPSLRSLRPFILIWWRF